MIKVTMKLSFAICFCLLSLFVMTETKKAMEEEDCEVCVKAIKQFDEELSDADRKSTATIEKKFKEFCKHKTGKIERFCYFLGGLETSATSTLQDISKPMSFHKPALKICEALRKKDAQICDLKFEKQIDLKTVNFKKLKVKDLKKILSDWGEDKACKGCTEKSDYVRAVKELLPKYAPEAVREEL